MENKFYVYAYLDPRKPGEYKYGEYTFGYEPFYIGKGNGKRIKFHLWESYTGYKRISGTNNYKCRKIRKIKKVTGKDPVIKKVCENVSEEKAFEIEKLLIVLIGRAGKNTGILTNCTDGGDGSTGLIFPESAKEKLRKKAKTRKHSIEAIKKISASSKKWAENNMEKLAEIRAICKTKHPEGINFKKYVVIDPDGNVQHIENLKKFCRDNNLKYNGLFAVTRGTYKNWKGWKCYLEGNKKEIQEKWSNIRGGKDKYFFKDPNGNLYTTAIQKRFCEEHNLNASSISKIIKGNQIQHKGWKVWKIGTPEPMIRKYVVAYPDGKELKIDNLHSFCNKHNLNSSNAWAVIHGRQKQCKGFIFREIRE